MKNTKNPRIAVNRTTEIPLTQIIPPRNPMRTTMDPDKLTDLANSIREAGLIHPITVTKRGTKFEIATGHRRFLACKKLRRKTITATIITADEAKLHQIRTHENFFRDDVPPSQQADYLAELQTREQLTSKQLSKIIGRPESWISERLAIIEYPKQLRAALDDETLTFAATRQLARIEDQDKRNNLIDYAITTGCTENTASQWRRDANAGTLDPAPVTQDEDTGQWSVNTQPIYSDCTACGKKVTLSQSIVIRVCPECAEKIVDRK